MTAPPSARVSIPARFNGPPESSNGGYACGLVARLLRAEAADVALRSPPPLDRPLTVEGGPGEGEVRLLDGGTLVADGRAIRSLELSVPDAVPVSVAREASRSFPWYEGHPFPTCFVCGPRREAGDGLRVFAGRAPDHDVYACPWLPADEWEEDGRVAGEIVWAALDCPSAVAAAAPAGHDAPAAVLARLAASLDAPVRACEPHVVISWSLGREGRKRSAGSAIVGPTGDVLARARALWIEVRG